MSDISQAKNASTPSFVTALVFNSAVFAAEIAVFTILRPRFQSIYEPRTYAPVPSKRVQSLGASIFAWPIALYKADYRQVIASNGLDTYFFLRFLRMMVRVFLPIWLLSWAVLLPVTSVNSHVPGISGLDRFSFGNVESTKQKRYVAHIILVYIFTGWIFYNIRKEMSHFVTARQKYLISVDHSTSVQAKTLLVTGIPRKYLNETALRKLFGALPGGVRKVWINRNLKHLPDVYQERIEACDKLESAETKLLALATKAAASNAAASADAATAEAGHVSRLDTLVPPSKRPTHRLGFLGLVGEKVDSVQWSRSEIVRCSEVLARARKVLESDDGQVEKEVNAETGSVDVALGVEDDFQGTGNEEKATVDGNSKVAGTKPSAAELEDYPTLNSAFITFNKQIAAHLGKQVLAHHEPYRMTGRYTEVSPDDVIWSNLGLNPYEIKVRTVISYAITVAMIIFWTIPVALIGVISNVHGLCTTYRWLAWLCDLPDVIVGIIQGILPPVLLVVLMMLLPIFLRLLAQFEGIPKKTSVELSLMTRYFIFQVVHSFLIVTLASGIIAALPSLAKNPSSVANLLAQNLPKASTFFLTYIILQGLSGTAAGFLQVVPLIVYYVKLVLLGSTPRSVYNIKYGLRSVQWGALWPGITLLTTVALGYMIISPVINGLACSTFFAFYMMYKYLFVWEFGQPPSSDTGGLYFPKAIQQLFVGLYVQQVCLCALFFLARNQDGKPSAVPQGALMVALIILTIFYQMFINDAYGPLIQALPLTLADKTYGAATAAVPTPAPVRAESAAPSLPPKAGDFGDDAKPPPEPESRDKGKGSGEPLPGDADTARQYRTEEEFGFAHPAASRPQRTVWLPKDTLGLAKNEEEANKKEGIDCAVANAVMNETGKVDVQGPPPDDIEV